MSARVNENHDAFSQAPILLPMVQTIAFSPILLADILGALVDIYEGVEHILLPLAAASNHILLPKLP